MKLYCVIILALFSISSCHGENFQANEDCGKQISKALGQINNFYFTKQTAYLDSALQILKGVENCSSKYTNIIFMDEVQVYFFKKDFMSALLALNKVPASVFPFPSFKEIYENKIKAKESETKGDTINQKKFYSAIISIYQKYIEENYQMFVTTLSQSDTQEINRTQENVILLELYFYISQTKGIENALKDIESFKVKVNGNLSYFSHLEEYIKSNDAKTIGILLY